MFTCPWFFFCPRKPHPKGNEYQTICCGESGITHGWDIVDVRDHPIPMEQTEFKTSTNTKTVVIIIRLTRALWSTGKAVIMESIFFVIKGLLEIRKRVFNGSVFIQEVLLAQGGPRRWH